MRSVHQKHCGAYLAVFPADKELYSLINGAVALETGLIANIRFYGPTQLEERVGQRIYSEDRSNEDPLWNVVNLLFLGRYIISPKTVALLLSFAHLARNHLEAIAGILDSQATEITKSTSAVKDRAKNLKKRTILPLLTSIHKAISSETVSALYPSYSVEQVISAVFCYKFSSRHHIKEFLDFLPDSIVNHNIKFSIDDNGLTRAAFEEIYQARRPFSLEEAYVLAHPDIVTSVTPYPVGAPLISNGSCLFYDRKNDSFVEELGTFADCVETASRHIFNLCLYNSSLKGFDITVLKNLLDTAPFPKRLEKIIEFYNIQNVYQANAGDTPIRSAWNRVVADLNENDSVSPVKYKKRTNEISSGLINFIFTFSQILGFEIDTSTLLMGSFDQKVLAVQKGFYAFLKVLNPHLTYQLTLQDMNWDSDKGDITGKVKTVVCHQTSPLFAFSLIVNKAHTEVGDIIRFKSLYSYPGRGKLIQENGIILSENTAAVSIGYLFPTSPPVRHLSPLYSLYQRSLNDDATKMEMIKDLPAINSDHLSLKDKTILSNMVINTLRAICWNDSYTAGLGLSII